jgi:hypothetical protein
VSSKPYDTKCARALAEMFLTERGEKRKHHWCLNLVRKHMAEHPAPMPSEVRAAAVFVDAFETA